MRLGGPLFETYADPEAWTDALRTAGYRAAYCPLGAEADDATVTAFATAAHAADIVIAEVGAWSNPISPDDTTRLAAIRYCCERLELADRIGARCCVNIAGARGGQWDGPDAANLSPDTFALIVDTTRAIVDTVQPTRTFFTLEAMQWIFPDSPDSYIELIRAIDRPRFAVHLDPVNMLNSPRRYFHNADFIRECFRKLGPHIKSCHAKDITLGRAALVHLDETRPGLGALDYHAYLTELNALDPDIPLMLEHLPDAAEYRAAADYIRGVAQELEGRG